MELHSKDVMKPKKIYNLKANQEENKMLRSKDIKKIKRWKEYQVNQAWDRIGQIGRFGCNFNIAPQNTTWVKDCWKDEDCFVIGSSMALKGFDLNKLNGLHTISINHVLEMWDKAEWHIVLDDRFFNKTTYKISDYKGLVFTSARCRNLPENDGIRFMSNGNRGYPTSRIEEGLYGMLTGSAAINLAIITGAKNIYLLGLDDTKQFIEKSKNQNNDDLKYHYIDNYTGEIPKKDYYQKYVNSRKGYKKFLQYHQNIIDVCKNGQMDWFKQISLKQFKEIIDKIPRKPKIEVVEKPFTVCHVASMNELGNMGDITRQVYSMSKGKHLFCNINSQLPKADIYLLECMLNQHDKYINFQKPYPKSKVISLLHTSGRCMPAACSDRVVTITNIWKRYLAQKFPINKIKTIHPGIDTSIYKKIDYNNKNFGRITRYSPGKVHSQWNNIALEILNKIPDSKYYFISKTLNKINHDRAFYIDDIQPFEHEKKVHALSNFSIFADMHHTFIETASLCMMEAMASGQAYILYSTAKQYAMEEILGESGIICDNILEFKEAIYEFLADIKLRAKYGIKAKERIQQFSVKSMIEKWDNLFLEVLNENT